MINAPILRISLLLLCAVLFISCDDMDDQREFEREAMAEPSGFTHTDSQGEVLEEDPDDWRISPMFGASISVEYPAYPNPTDGENVTITLRFSGTDVVAGLQVFSYYQQREFREIYFDDSDIPLFKDIVFDPRRLDPSGVLDEARGLHRVFIYDLNDNLITYGDIKVE